MLEVQEDEKKITEIDELNNNLPNDDISAGTNLVDPSDTYSSKSDNLSNILNFDSLNNVPEPNCLALTVRKDYNLMIVKNIFTASGRLSWKIVLATVVLNFLNMIF